MNNIMEYKGYKAKIEYSSEDKVFFGKVLGINDLIIFDGTQVNELEACFHKVIDDYLETCARIGKNPEKMYSGTFNVRIKPEVHRAIALKAYEENMTLNQYVERALTYSVDDRVNNLSCRLKKTEEKVISQKFYNDIWKQNNEIHYYKI